MRRVLCVQAFRCFLPLSLSAVVAGTLLGQEGAVRGRVLDSRGEPLRDANVAFVHGRRVVTTNESGQFVLDSVGPGRHLLLVRRLGFRPETSMVQVHERGIATLELRLAPVVAALPPLYVRASRSVGSRRLDGFYSRLESRSGGILLTRDQLSLGNPSSLVDVFRRVSGASVTHGGRSVRLRGRSCPPLVWLDDVVMPAGEVDLGSISPGSLEGVEVYPSSTGAPARYQHFRETNCGTVLLWSVDPRQEARRRARYSSSAYIERLLAAREVFPPDDVERPARPDSASWPPIEYPPELANRKMAGVVHLELIVDTSGAVESGSVGVVSASHPLLGNAAAEAVLRARFFPAVRNSRKVRQLVFLPVVIERTRRS